MILLKNILIATDFGEAADAALLYGRTLARAFGATLHVLHVTEDIYGRAFGAETYIPSLPAVQGDVDEAARRQLDELLIDSDGSGPTTKKVIRSSNSPARTILEYAREAGVDLIVLGTHGRGPLAHVLMGSVAEHVVRTAPCPVLTVRHPEREFVVPDTLATVKHA
jgi:nucleotide-binding universal stress UspA family protein